MKTRETVKNAKRCSAAPFAELRGPAVPRKGVPIRQAGYLADLKKIHGGSLVRRILDGGSAASRLFCVLGLTRVCNNHCVFCFESRGGEPFRPLDEIKAEMESIRKRGVSRIIVSGLEPTIHPLFPEIIGLAQKAGFSYIQTTTNGRMFCNRTFLKDCVAAGLNKIIFSMHGHTAGLHDSQTGVKGSFLQSLAGLKNALEIKGLTVEVHSVLNRLNLKYASDIMRFFNGLGVAKFHFLQVVLDTRVLSENNNIHLNNDGSLIYVWKHFEFSKDDSIRAFGPEALRQHVNDEVTLWYQWGMFREFIETGKVMACRGGKCRYCFMNDFCNDLVHFIRTGSLDPKTPPPCRMGTPFRGTAGLLSAAKGACDRTSRGRSILRLDKFRKNNTDATRLQRFKRPRPPGEDTTAIAVAFMDYYVNHRYFIKGRTCTGCDHNRSCEGMNVREILKSGFPETKS